MPRNSASEIEAVRLPETVAGKPNASILVAEDSAIYRRIIETHLKEWGFDFVCVKDGEAAWNALSKPGAPRLALVDWVLPGLDGVELCRRLRRRPESDPYTYTILLTAKSQRGAMLEAMAAGVDDFLAKPFDPAELRARLVAGRRIVDLQQKLFSANHALQFAACHDFLTGVWNRGEIAAFLQRELSRARRKSIPVGIVLADVDHFKRINDEFGHETGDGVLKEIARRFTSSLREYDGVGRYGGEEFLLVIPNCDLTTTVRRANDVRQQVCATPIVTAHGTVQVTVSMGATVAVATLDSEPLLHLADTALYQAKRNGRNRVEQAATEAAAAAASA
jgi:two-component system, cell cycle response regulator